MKMKRLMRLSLAVLSACLGGWLAGSPASGQAPDPGTYSAERFEVKATRGHKAAMRDGVRLSVDVFQPQSAGRFPAILIITPYSNNPGYLARASWFAKRGYIVAVADSRGRFDSEGTWDPFDPTHKTDGYDLVEWLAAQPWCDGKVGMMGLSYMGWTQWWTATQAPPSLRTIVPEVAPPDQFDNLPYQNGVLVGVMLDWAGQMAGRVGQTLGPGPYGGFAADERRRKDYMQRPYLKLNESRGAIDAPWFEKWIRGHTASDPYWRGIAYQTPESYAKVAVPSLAVTGWFDADFNGSPMNYLAMKRHGATDAARRPRLVIGPWPHIFNQNRKVGAFDYGPQAVIDWDGYVCRWFDHWLKGLDNGVMNDAPVHVFVMGSNRWSAEQDWPLPQTQWTKYFLHSGGRANSTDGDGVLNTSSPAATAEAAADTYTYDPDRPSQSPFTGGHLEDGAVDTRKSSSGSDVLVYTTPPLDEDVEVIGPITAKLYAATSARDTDWMVRLIDVQPDGYSAMLSEGIMRARHRDPKRAGAFHAGKLSVIEPGQVYEYTIEFWRATANVFAKGHRIRVEVSSSFFPYYLPNLNTGADNIGLETTPVVAEQKILHTPEHPSHLVLPVIPRRLAQNQATNEAALLREATPAADASAPPPPLEPAEALQKLHVPAGYKAEIVVAEPLVFDPVAFDWDGRGRLWIVEMADYPLGMDGHGKHGGRIRVLQDDDGDGRYDKQTLFADGLNFPNGILTWRDGVIVTATPNILFLRDVDGDGRSDQEEVLVSGLQEGNQQLRANGLRWGLDNWVYVAIGGIAADKPLKSLRSGQVVPVGDRDFRFRPDTGELEPQSGPSQFGRNRDNWGRWFGTQNAKPLWHYVLPDQYLRRNPHFGAGQTVVHLLGPPSPPVYPASHAEKRFHDFVSAGHYTSACSGVISRDRLMFDASDRHALICEPFHNLIQHVRLQEEGVSFTAEAVQGENRFDFFASEDRWCRPVMVREGPDGALWIADMYRYMIEHPHWLPQSGRDELQPHYRLGDDRGRIYRVSRDGMPGFQPVRFDSLGTADLVAALDSTNGWRRDKVHQMLLWRADKAAVAPLLALAEHNENPLARLHALCVLDGLNELPPASVARALADPDPGVRENALRLAETRFTPEVLAAAVRLADDADAKVRLQLAFSLGDSKDAAAGETLGRMLVRDAANPLLVSAVMSSALPHIRPLAAAAAGNPQRLPVDTLLTIALGLNDRAALEILLRPILTPSNARFTPEQIAALTRFLDQLAQRSSTVDKLRGVDSGDPLSRLLEKFSVLVAQARRTAADPGVPSLERIAAAAILSRDPASQDEALPLLTAWLDPQHPAEAQAAAIEGLVAIPKPEVPAAFAEAWPKLSPATQAIALDAWMSREPWAFDLAGRLERKDVPVSTVGAAHRSRLIRHNSQRISQAAAKAFGTTSSTRGQAVENYLPALSLPGNPSQGREVFTKVCTACHKRGSEGRDHGLGPDLLTVVSHSPEKLLRNILDPSADIQPGFTPYTCTLTTGLQIHGLLASETANSIVMKLPDGTPRVVLRNQIEELRCQNLSFMPEGLEKLITHQQMADLIAFLRTPLEIAK